MSDWLVWGPSAVYLTSVLGFGAGVLALELAATGMASLGFVVGISGLAATVALERQSRRREVWLDG